MKKIFFATILLFLGLGQVWGQTFIATSPSSNSITTNNVTVSSSNGIQNKTFNGTASTKVWKVDSKPTSITSTTANIYKIVFTACYNSSGSSTQSCNVTVSTDGSTYSTLSSGVTVSGGTGTTSTSTDNIYVLGNDKYSTVTVTFNSTLYRYVRIEKDGKETWVNSIKVYTAPTALTKGTATETTCPMTVTDGGNTNNYEFYYNTASTAPTSSSTATATFTSKTPTLTSLSDGTTYYCWVRSKYSSTEKSPWKALTGSTFTTVNAAPTWYTLSYDANGGTGSMPSHDFISGTTVHASQNTSFTPPSGKIFKCWNTKANGSGTEYKEWESFTLSANTTLYAQWITASTSGSYCISMYNLNVSDQMKYFTYSGYDDMQILDLEVPNYKTSTNNFWVGKGGSWKTGDLGNSGASSANERLEDLCLKGNRDIKLGTGSQGVLARFFVYDNSTYNNLYVEFTPKQYSLIWGKDGSSWSPVKLYPSGYENEWTSEVVTLTSEQISLYKYYVGILKADDGVAYWYKSNTLTVGSMGTYNKTTDTWGGNVSTLSAGAKGFFRMWQDATGYDNWRCHFVPVYTLSYNANSGSGAPAAVYVASEGDDSHRRIYISATEPTRTGYTFAGWATSSSRASSGTVDYEAGDDITISADTELFAVWNCITPDAPTAAKISASDQCQGTGVTFSANTTGLPSYVTWYWQTAADGTSTTYPASSNYTTSTSAGTYTMYLRAKNTACGEWSNSASTPSKSATVYAGTTITTQPTTSVTGHVGVSFTVGTNLVASGASLTYKWYSYTSSGGAGEAEIAGATSTTYTTSKSTGTYYYKVKVSGTCGDPVYSNMITVTVDNKHLLSYNDNSGSGAPGSSYVAPGSTTLSSTIPTRSGFVFLGWNTNSSGTGSMYQPGATYTMPSTATTLYAAWGSPCFNVSDASKNTMPDGQPAGTVITAGGMINGTITGGTLTYTGTDAAGLNGNAKGLIFNNDNDELTVSLSGGMLQEGTVIVIGSYGTASSSSHTNGLKVSGNSMSPATVVSSTSNNSISQRYVVTDGDGIEGTSCFTIRRVASTDQVMLNTISVAGCADCTPITPTLTYDNTTIWVGESVATPTLNKDGSTGSVTYSSSNTDAATVNESTGVVTAVAHGTTTITATIDADGTHCGNTVSCNITVKTMDCGSNYIAKVDLTSATTADKTNATATVVLGSKDDKDPAGCYKLTGNGKYLLFGLANGYTFKENDTIVYRIYTKQSYIYIHNTDYSTDLTTSNAVWSKTDLTTGQTVDIEIPLTSALAASFNTNNKVLIMRNGNVGQNHDIFWVRVKRYTCPDVVLYDAKTNGNWGTATNWIGATGRGAGLPTIADRAVIKKPVAVNVTNAKAADVVLDQHSGNTGQLVLDAGKELVVSRTVRKTTDGSSYTATGENDIVFGSTSALGLGALVMGEHNGTNKATVNFYTKSTGKKDDTSIAQYVGTPFNDETNILYNWYNSWVYKIIYDGSGNIGWERVNEGQGMTPFKGYCVFSADAWGNVAGHTYWMQGTLVSSDNKTCSGLNWQSGSGTENENNENLLANSWIAPIKIKAMQTTDFVNADATIYIFNSTDSTSFLSGGFEGNYSTVTVGTCEETDLIPAMQSFSVFTTGSSASVTLDYSKIVYTPALAGTTPTPNKAPQRAGASEGEADKMRLFVRTEDGYGDMLYMWEREDFTEGFENGWDGRKLFGESYAPQLYAITPDGEMAVNCVPTFEGTVLGFRKGTEDDVYTFTFEYDGENTWYLNDLREQTSTLISSESRYMFMASDEDMVARFIISRTPIHHVATGIQQSAVSGQQSVVRKIVIDDHVFIIRNGQMYDVTGVMVR